MEIMPILRKRAYEYIRGMASHSAREGHTRLSDEFADTAKIRGNGERE